MSITGVITHLRFVGSSPPSETSSFASKLPASKSWRASIPQELFTVWHLKIQGQITRNFLVDHHLQNSNGHFMDILMGMKTMISPSFSPFRDVASKHVARLLLAQLRGCSFLACLNSILMAKKYS